MKITSVSVQVGTTITTNFNSVRNDVGFTADLTEDDDPDEVVRQLQLRCRDLLLKRSDENGEKRTEHPS